MKQLTKEQVLRMHSRMIAETGGTDGIRDEGLLESALETPFQSFGDTELYPTIWQKAARLGFGLVKNHAFVDGNKRIGAHVMLVFLALNGVEVSYTQTELADAILDIASGNADAKILEKWLISHSE